jgi:hypothetical protein
MRAFVFAAALVAVSPAVAQSPDAAAVVAAERAFAADAPSMGIAGSFNKWSTPDAILIGGGQVLRIGEAYPDGPRPPDEPLLEWWPNFAGISRSGDLGFTTGGVQVGGRRTGHYFTVWKRQADGSWKWVYDGGSGASAAGVPGPDSEPRILPLATVGSTSPDAAMNEVLVAEEALAAEASDDQKAAHLSAMAADGRLYVAPLPPADGREAFGAALDGWPARFDFGAAEGGGASDAGDMVWTYGPAAWSREGQARTGHFVRLWQKRPEGWKLVMAQLIPAPIAPPPPAGG